MGVKSLKTYLNSEERRQNTFFAIVYGMIDGYLERKDNFSAEEVKWLESTHTSLFEYIGALGKRVGQDELMRIYREARDNKAELKPRNYDGQYIVDKNALEEICRMAVETHCFGCKKERWQDCDLYKFMDKCGMGNSDEKDGKCTFWYPEIKEENYDKDK